MTKRRPRKQERLWEWGGLGAGTADRPRRSWLRASECHRTWHKLSAQDLGAADICRQLRLEEVTTDRT